MSLNPKRSLYLNKRCKALVEDHGKVQFILFPFEEGRRFEMYSLEMDCGGYLSAEAHIEGTEEFITVFEGDHHSYRS